tara:strand:- start:747 stop:1097 length:351 start_codon:yes stop_codon:yes gene_type:complete
MDFFSLVVGFLIGTATGAAGNYMADRFTDSRREKKQVKENERLWREVEARFPDLIEEMKEDFSNPEHRDTRAFFVKSSKTSIGFLTEPCFQYCVFQTKVATDSRRSLPPIPRESCH